jgi:hypothetical protein
MPDGPAADSEARHVRAAGYTEEERRNAVLSVAKEVENHLFRLDQLQQELRRIARAPAVPNPDAGTHHG